ncbi:MAG: hypothetical protein GEU93_02165 [Propionibacteriales bacterium]|nr:hypothetical protein [Propionibacteriales bacterium]
MTTTTHTLTGRASKLNGAGAYTAACRCGWTSPRRVTAQKAYADVDEHVSDANDPCPGPDCNGCPRHLPHLDATGEPILHSDFDPHDREVVFYGFIPDGRSLWVDADTEENQ